MEMLVLEDYRLIEFDLICESCYENDITYISIK